MWSAKDLVHQKTKDVPCNTSIYFAVNGEGALDMTVCNRSNDLVWGALGANAVHMSVLQEYIAARLDRDVGQYYQFTNNLHGYLTTIEPLRGLAARQGEQSPYALGLVRPYPMLDFTPEGAVGKYERDVIQFVDAAWLCYKTKSAAAALLVCDKIHAPDWKKACKEWLQRKIDKSIAKDDGVKYE
jgi:hypothetical protein